MANSYKIISFLKFGGEKEMTDLLENGTIYMNPINKFRSIEDNNLRGDSFEGIFKIWNLPPGQFEIPQLNHKGNYLRMHITQSYQNVLGNIYSLYCISSYGFENPDSFSIDNRMKDFGSHFVFIKDLPEFFPLLKASLTLTGCKFFHGFVEYFDKNSINGHISVFQKPMEYEYQKEFRFFIERETTDPLIFSIGNLSHIAEIFKSELASEIKLSKNGL